MTAHSTAPCPCSLTEAPRHILDPFKRIEWARGHLGKLGEPCENPDPDEPWAVQAAWHRAGIRICAQNQINYGVADIRAVFADLIDGLNRDHWVAEMIRERVGVE